MVAKSTSSRKSMEV